jgi:ATP-dependent DNA ligase
LDVVITEINRKTDLKIGLQALPIEEREAQLEELLKKPPGTCHWVKPVMVCQVKFTEWARDDRLRQPVFLGLREEKKAREVMRENVIRLWLLLGHAFATSFS